MTATEPEYYFEPDGDAVRPLPIARGPWAEDMLHGRLLGGLAARAVEAALPADGWRVARLTVDLFRPAGMEPVHVTTVPVREGRKVQVNDALIECGGHRVGRATAVALPVAADPPGRVWQPEPSRWPDPESLAPPTTGHGDDQPWKFRPVRGGFESEGRAALWANDTGDLVAGEALTPFVRAILAGDIACPLANTSDEGVHFINADYTVMLGRYPTGGWIGIETDQRIAADGIAIAASTLSDVDGPFGTSGGTSLARPPLIRDQ